MNQPGSLIPDELRRMCTPLRTAVSVTLGPVDPTTLALLEERGFDQAPVKDSTGRVVGLVKTHHLRALAERAEHLPAKDLMLHEDGWWLQIRSSVTIDALLERMTRRRAVILVEDNESTPFDNAESVLGLLTISDLNRHMMRSALYSLMAHVEAELAALVETTIPDAWAWIHGLNENHQVTILGYWELSKRRGVDVGPVAATTLSQLLQVTARSKALLALLGFASRNQFEDQTGRIPDLRNRVMHPVRPLVLDPEDIANVCQAVAAVRILATRMARTVGDPTISATGRIPPAAEPER